MRVSTAMGDRACDRAYASVARCNPSVKLRAGRKPFFQLICDADNTNGFAFVLFFAVEFELLLKALYRRRVSSWTSRLIRSCLLVPQGFLQTLGLNGYIFNHYIIPVKLLAFLFRHCLCGHFGCVRIKSITPERVVARPVDLHIRVQRKRA